MKLNAELGAANEKLQKARTETVLGMATLSEYRDHDTGLHLQRVSQLCRILADELRRTPPLDSYITDEYVEDIVLSSLLHDIGKVGVADSVLLKPGRLTDEEFEAVKAHAVVGGDALESVEKRMAGQSFFTLGKQVAYCHHERWDGKAIPAASVVISYHCQPALLLWPTPTMPLLQIVSTGRHCRMKRQCVEFMKPVERSLTPAWLTPWLPVSIACGL